jgi:Raf kinase inhibitor-like YbhB/YbcL family protein
MQIVSPAFEQGRELPTIYTCDGSNISPPLTFLDVPDTTKTLGLLVDDPDSPSGKFVHWLLWNIDPLTREIPEGSPPPISVVGKNDFGDDRYAGPCPPSGTHRYRFTLYALDISLDLPPGSRVNDFINATQGHILEEVVLTGTYSKK